MQRSNRRLVLAAMVIVAGAAVTTAWLEAQGPADTQRPVVEAAIGGRPDGNGGWFRTGPVGVNLMATDNVGVVRLQYSLDGGTTYADAPITPGPAVRAAVQVNQQGLTQLRYRAFDAAGNVAPEPPAPAPAQPAPGGRGAGGRGGGGGGGGRGAADGPGSIAVRIDGQPPVAAWPAVVNDAILQSQTLRPELSDANGSGAVAIRRMEVDGTHVFPFAQTLNTFPVGEHSQVVTLQDAAGNALTYTRKFLVTTSFEDLAAVLAQYETNALRTTLATAAAAGDRGIRLATPYGFRPGQTLVVGSGAEQETVTIAAVPSPPPREGANIELSAPLARAHAAGEATPVSNPRPIISAAVASSLKAVVSEASQRAAAQQTAQAVDALRRFNAAVAAQVLPAGERTLQRAALTSAGQALIDQIQGRPRPVVTNALTTAAATPALRVFTDPTAPTRNAGATYRVLVNGNTNGFRHEHVTDTEALVQKLGAANGFDVDFWDKGAGNGPGRQTPNGVSLATSPFLDLNTLKQYRTLVFVSTVGRDPGGSLNAAEFANLQAYIRGGGGLVAIHGATDAYQDNPWYVELVGGGFSGHGGNVAGIMPDCPSCGEVELITDDPSHPATQHLRARFPIHDELYNTSRNPVTLGLVHPLVLMNEATVVGQINYNVGPLMNSDRHGMIWCRNFEGGRTFTSVIGHSWHLTHEPWYQQMLLKGIQTTAGVVAANCVTYAEVRDVVAAAQSAGSITTAAAAMLTTALTAASREYERGNYRAALPQLDTFLAEAQRSGAASAGLRAKGLELVAWMKTSGGAR